MKFLKTFVLAIALLPFFNQTNASSKDSIPLKYGDHHPGIRRDPAMNHWRQMRFGEFIHFGLYSILGGTWQGKHYNGAAEWIKAWAHIPDSAYFALIHQFNPVNFDAGKWAAMAKQMGVKYLRITTKHHEGFCLWPSQYTDFDIASSPYKKDFLGELVKACDKEGIDISFYYSVLDWHHPDWRYTIKTKEDSLAFERYKLYVKNQLTELLERYPSVIGLWFDGTWDKSWESNGKFSYELAQYLKKIHPGLIINSRMRADDYGKRHFDSNGHLMGDYASGWERKLPPVTDTEVINYDWECIMTIPGNQWGYNAIWNGHVKTPIELIEMMAHTVSMGGNFMVNFGPKPDGTFREEEKLTAKIIGGWMDVNGAAIYGCDHAKNWKKQDWGYYTSDTAQDKVYLIVFNTPVSGLLRIETPKNIKITRDYSITAPDANLKLENIGKNEYFIHLKEKTYNQPYVIVLEIQKKLNDSKDGHYQPAKT